MSILDNYYGEGKSIRDKIEELEEENKKLSEGKIIYASEKEQRHYVDILEENEKLKEENELLKQCLDKLMIDADVINVKIHGELGDYCYVRSDVKIS